MSVLFGMLTADPVLQQEQLESTAVTAHTDTPAYGEMPTGWVQSLTDRNERFVSNQIRLHVFRLRPGDDLMSGIRSYVKQNNIQAAVLLGAVGSLTHASLRYANASDADVLTGHFEVVSITGTAEQGGEHIHLSISKNDGSVVGGHLMSGSKIYTTAEITLGEIVDAKFTRESDKDGSGWDELKIYPANAIN